MRHIFALLSSRWPRASGWISACLAVVVLAILLGIHHGVRAARPGDTVAIVGILGVFAALVAGLVYLLLARGERRSEAQGQADAAARRSAEDALRERDVMFRTLAETAGVAICIFQDGRFVYVNPSFAALTGHTPEAMLAMRPHDLVHPDSWPVMMDRMSARAGGDVAHAEYELKLRTTEGGARWASCSASMIDYLGRPAVLGAGVDITERRRAEDALRGRDAQYRSIFETIQDVYFSADLDGRLRLVSPSVTAVAGYGPDEVIGRTMVSFAARPERFGLFSEQLAHAGRLYDFETHLYAKDGRVIVMSTNALLLRDDAGHPIGIEGTLRDITDRKQSEERMRRAHRALHALRAVDALRRRALSEEAYLQETCWALTEVGGYRLAWVGMLARTEDGAMAPLACAGGPPPTLTHALRHPAILAATHAETATARHLTTDAAAPALAAEARAGGYAAIAAFPLRVEDAREALVICAVEGDAFDDEELALLTELAEGVADGLTATRLHAERALAERALAATRARLELLVSATPAVIYSRDARTGVPTFISDNLRALLGFEPGVIYGDPPAWQQRIHPEDQRACADAEKQLRERGQAIAEYRFRHRDGIYRWIHDEARLLREADGAPREIVGVLVDISTYKFIEEAFHETSGTLEAVLRVAQVPLVTLDPVGRVTAWNRAAADAFGWDEPEALGESLPLLPEGALPGFVQACLRAWQQGDVVGPTARLTTRDGLPVTGRLLAAPVRDAQGEIAGVAIAFDLQEAEVADDADLALRDLD
jgi:PAS domain S-box-containing protein